MIRANPAGEHPKIEKSAYVDPTASIIGRVSIGKNVFVGPQAVIRADEPGSSIIIKDNCNIQDRVVIHALTGTSVFVGANTSLSHGCIIHGPCKIGKNCFIGFGSVVFGAELRMNVIVKHLAVVENIKVPPWRLIPSGAVIGSKEKLNELGFCPKGLKRFSSQVVKTNLNLVRGYNNVK